MYSFIFSANILWNIRLLPQPQLFSLSLAVLYIVSTAFLIILHLHILEEVLAPRTERRELAECYILSVCSVCPNSKLHSPPHPSLFISLSHCTILFDQPVDCLLCFVGIKLPGSRVNEREERDCGAFFT